MMVPTILVIGSTGNTGKNVMRTLPRLLKRDGVDQRVLGLTRSLESPSAKSLSEVDGVEMEEKDWTEIDSEWLQSRNVKKVFIAPHNLPNQFTDESGLYLALLRAGVKYVVKISTNTKYVTPTNAVFYGRSHWAIETLLSQPQFQDLHWTSLQPNFYSNMYLASAAEWVNKYKKTGIQEPLKLILGADQAAALVDPEDVGLVGANLLALDDHSLYNGRSFTVSGPEDVTGNDIVRLVEKLAGTRVNDKTFEDKEWIEGLAKSGAYPQKLLSSILAGHDFLWRGDCTLAKTPTSKEIIQLARPTRTMKDVITSMLDSCDARSG